MTALKKILTFFFYAIIIFIGVTFAVSNRGRVDLTFFPVPYIASVPVFLFAIVVFALGCFLGWGIAHMGTFKRHLQHRETNKRMAALENELTALRSEQMLRKPASSLLK